MAPKKFNEISRLKDKIDHALDNNNFEELNSLSNSLETIVKTLVEDREITHNLSKSEINSLVELLEDVGRYEELTKKRFKDYTYGVSRSRKMHEAYKQNRG
tara:strand:+ start:374 stop:676 length:303 start_codon:yes stop_codon:yes gene_type:complete